MTNPVGLTNHEVSIMTITTLILIYYCDISNYLNLQLQFVLVYYHKGNRMGVMQGAGMEEIIYVHV